MPYRPRELVIRAREAATLLLATLDRNEMVPRFLDMYAARIPPAGPRRSAGLYREQLETIRREAMLAMVLRIEAALPTRMKVRVTVRGAGGPQENEKGRKAKGGKQKAIAGTGHSAAGYVPRGIFRGAGAGAGMDRRGRRRILARLGALRKLNAASGAGTGCA